MPHATPRPGTPSGQQRRKGLKGVPCCISASRGSAPKSVGQGTDVLTTFGPIWLLTLAGYLARRGGLFDAGSALTLSRAVYYLAMPAALFLTLWHTPLDGQSVRPFAAFVVSTLCAIGLGWTVAARLSGRDRGESAIWGMSAGYVNSANLGLPIALQVLGDVSLLSEIVLFQVLLVTPVLLVALDRHSDSEGRFRWGRLATLPFRNPVIIASAAGLVASATQLRLPSVPEDSLRLLAGAAVPLALVSLGASLRADRSDQRSAGPDGGMVTVAGLTSIKLVAQPLVAFLAALALHCDAQQLLAVAVCAGLPTAQNTYIFAQSHASAPVLASRVVVATTVLSMATLASIVGLMNTS